MGIQHAKPNTRQRMRTPRPTADTDPRRWVDATRRAQTRSEPSLRARVAAAFRGLGKGLDEKATYEQTKRFFRTGGTEWARRLF